MLSFSNGLRSHAAQTSFFALLVVLVLTSYFTQNLWMLTFSEAGSDPPSFVIEPPGGSETLASIETTTMGAVGGGGGGSLSGRQHEVMTPASFSSPQSTPTKVELVASLEQRGGDELQPLREGKGEAASSSIGPTGERKGNDSQPLIAETMDTASASIGPTKSDNSRLTFGPTPPSNPSSVADSPVANATVSTTFARTPNPFQVPLWEPPSLANPEVISEFNDWKWALPTRLTNRTDYIAQRYLPHEVKDRCSGMCCVGVVQFGAGNFYPKPKCFRQMDLMADYELVHTNRSVYSLVDSIKLYRRMHGEDAQLRILFIGDSVTGQYYAAALCDALRNEAVSRVLGVRFRKVEDPGIQSYHKLAISDSVIRLKDDPPERNTSVVFINNYQVYTNPARLESIFGEFDIIFLGWGLHYDPGNLPYFARHLQHAVRAVTKASTRAKLFLWLGSPKQHFLYMGDPNNTDGSYSKNKAYSMVQTCGPSVRVPFSSPLFDVRNKAAATTMSQANWTVRWVNVSEYEVDCEKVERETAGERPVLHMLQNFGWTAPFYRNHDSYSSNQSVHQRDCTHPCWAPNLYEPTWDALYLVLSSRACDKAAKLREPRFPSNTWTAAFVNKSRQGEVKIEAHDTLGLYSVGERLFNMLDRLKNATSSTNSTGDDR